MSQKQKASVAFLALMLLVWCASVWADSDPGEMYCLPEQPSDNFVAGDDFSPKVGVQRNQVLLEIVTGTW